MAFCRGLCARALPPGWLWLLPTRTMAVRLLPRVRPLGQNARGHYAAKLATYYRYRDSGAYRRDYQSFPTLLVVTTTEVAEARFADQAYLAQQRHDSAPLNDLPDNHQPHRSLPRRRHRTDLALRRSTMGG